MLDCLSSVKDQYEAMEQALVDINKELKIKPLKVAEYIKNLSKPHDVMDL